MSTELTVTDTHVSDGFDTIPTETARGVIRGVKVKFDNGDHVATDNTVLPESMVVGNVAIFDQRWKNGLPIETISYAGGRPLDDIDELNGAIPKEEWEESPFGGGPKPPWQRQYCVYMADPSTGRLYTSINSTIGQARAFETLVERVRFMRQLRGPHVTPIVKLTSASMKTRYGVKERPEFEIVGWQNLGGNAPQMIAPTTAEQINDAIPF